MGMPEFGYKRETLSRESRPFYIGLSDADIEEMLADLGLHSLDELYSHVRSDVFIEELLGVPEPMEYGELAQHLFTLSQKNQTRSSFLGDGLPTLKQLPIVAEICKIRELGTAYTPYQPERSQGTLLSLWIYQNAIAALTGFEAINASLWERSTCLFEAIQCALRQVRKTDTAILCSNLHPSDLEVLHTLSRDTGLKLRVVAYNPATGLIDLGQLQTVLDEEPSAACLVYPQLGCTGALENVDELTELAQSRNLKAIACIDVARLAQDGLKPPSEYGPNGADIFVSEGQHLALSPNYGGPGLGIFGVRYNEGEKTAVRNTAGRYVGKAKDMEGQDCKVMVLSTREQHIRKEKATSNICSNQSFIATLAGASLLSRGAQGLRTANEEGCKKARHAFEFLCSLESLTPAHPDSTFFHEFALLLPESAQALIQDAQKEGLLPGADITARLGKPALLVSFSETQSDEDIQKLYDFFAKRYSRTQAVITAPKIAPKHLRKSAPVLPALTDTDILAWYQKIGDLNLSPDKGLYPLGSCTMKYNPYINEWAAALPGFTSMHPQSPVESTQGCLEILYSIQELFKSITGLPAVTTQPVAGAQGELVGIKMFQAYHRDHSSTERDIILLPRSAHGTNFATATVAGYQTKGRGNKATGIQLINATPEGLIDQDHLQELLQTFSGRICGIMITNPNTCGLLEKDFADIASRIHAEGGLVYMDGANMNAIAGWMDLNRLGVDAVHQNLHKTWSIPHGGGGPGDCVVAVSEKLKDYLPGLQVTYSTAEGYQYTRSPKSIGSFHRHHGNFAHKVRCYTYLRALGNTGIRKMSACATLAARWLHHRLQRDWPSLPSTGQEPRMHEFILTLSPQTFERIEASGIPTAQIIARVGKLFLDFGLHAPTVAWPETYGLMVEPTESFTLQELKHFAKVLDTIKGLLEEHPEVLQTVPHFTSISRVDEVEANKNPVLSEPFTELPRFEANPMDPQTLLSLPVEEIRQKILSAHLEKVPTH